MWGWTVWLYLRCIALIDGFVLWCWYGQIDGLIGSRGITPVNQFIRAKNKKNWKWIWTPTLFTLWDSDIALKLVCLLGLLCSSLAFLNILPSLNFLIFGICYYSFLVVSVPWLGLQMHANVIELCFVSVVFGLLSDTHPEFLIYAGRWLIFRKMLSCGIGKIVSSDNSWKNLTAMDWHYWTMPLPNPLSPYMHRMPKSFHKFEVLMTHFIEIPLCFLAFGPFPICRILVFIGFVGLNVVINLTGNFGHLGLMTIIECIPLLDDEILGYVFPLPTLPPSHLPESTLLITIGWLFLSFYAILTFLSLLEVYDISLYDWINQFSPLQWLFEVHKWTTVYKITNRYSKFAHMTKFRCEVTVEGSNDTYEWKEYIFKYKPSEINKKPPVLFGYLPSLDWMLWFIPLGLTRGGNIPPWFINFQVALLEGRKEVINLLSFNPFPDDPPKHVRTLIYEYTYAYSDSPNQLPQWWNRNKIASYQFSN